MVNTVGWYKRSKDQRLCRCLSARKPEGRDVADISASPRSATSGRSLLELRHRGHARVEDRIRTGKDSGFGRFPSRQFAINRAWLELALVGIWPWATDLANIYARLDALPPTDG